MLKAFGLIFISLLLATCVTVVGNVLGSDFSAHYAKNNSIEILATIYALNIATATFLIGSLLNIEERIKEDAFDGARREIKHNLYAMTVLFGLNIVFVAMLGNQEGVIATTGIKINDAIATGVIAILFFYVYLLLEVIRAAFRIRVPKD